jgi:hypothetical protein
MRKNARWAEKFAHFAWRPGGAPKVFSCSNRRELSTRIQPCHKYTLLATYIVTLEPVNCLASSVTVTAAMAESRSRRRRHPEVTNYGQSLLKPCAIVGPASIYKVNNDHWAFHPVDQSVFAFHCRRSCILCQSALSFSAPVVNPSTFSS